MNRNYNEMIDSAPHYAQAVASHSVSTQNVAGYHRPESRLSVSEDEKATLRFTPARITESYPREGDGSTIALPASPLLEAGVREIDLDELRPGDQVLIETGHSIYSFTIVDPVAPSGKLIGGILGNRQVKACLLPPQRETRGLRIFHRNLRAGARLSFLLEWGDGLRTLTTSSVTRLVHRREA